MDCRFSARFWAVSRICLLLYLVPGRSSGQDIIFQVHGQETGEFLSRSAGVGDINHDGSPDVLVSSTIACSLRLYSGRTHALIREIVGEIPGTTLALGSSIDGAGDFDGDGTLDLLAGAAGDSQMGIDGGGSIRVYSGRDGDELGRWNGNIDNGYFGRGVAGLGDIDGDGYADVAGVGLFDVVWVLGGPDMHLIRYHSGVLTRPSVAGVGDLDGDGRADYICGWPQDSTNGQWTGRATVYSGRTGNEIFSVYGETPQGGGVTGDHLGVSVAGVGDVNGDGMFDFAVGAPGEVDLQFTANHGMARVYSGSNASVIWEWQAVDYTSGAHSMIGYRIDGGGDINGDGFNDMLVAAPKDGPLHNGTVLVCSGRTGELLWRSFDSAPSSQLWAISLVGDINADGLADFAQGNPNVDQPADGAGRVTIYAGARGDVDHICPAAPNSVGPGAQLDNHGPIGIRNNWLTLAATGAVPGELALILYGPETTAASFGDGTLCIGWPIRRLLPALTVDAGGTVQRMLDFDNEPLEHTGPGGIAPGSTAVFQLWYRDPQGPSGNGFNLSDALRIRFLP